ncbi:unnamed protein product [Trichogramma brassicae]|uniref:CUB domain-containing protein n=1 Tax=Trichogramma brassicae TaxID=86971 RepID=A0A6H5IIJ8_9HYME|nr:unnamed protein product [Trichogramma brassicae]
MNFKRRCSSSHLAYTAAPLPREALSDSDCESYISHNRLDLIVARTLLLLLLLLLTHYSLQRARQYQRAKRSIRSIYVLIIAMSLVCERRAGVRWSQRAREAAAAAVVRAVVPCDYAIGELELQGRKPRPATFPATCINSFVNKRSTERRFGARSILRIRLDGLRAKTMFTRHRVPRDNEQRTLYYACKLFKRRIGGLCATPKRREFDLNICINIKSGSNVKRASARYSARLVGCRASARERLLVSMTMSLLLLLLQRPEVAASASPSETTTSDNVGGGGESCGGHLTARRGVLSTPNFPGQFSTPIHCRWLLDASDLADRPNASIVVYLTQLYAFRGLRFHEYAYYENEATNFGGALLREIDEAGVFEIGTVRTYRPYLLVDFRLERLEGNHVRVLDRLLDVYGFNLTYEMTDDIAPKESCTLSNCSFTGNCFLASDRARRGIQGSPWAPGRFTVIASRASGASTAATDHFALLNAEIQYARMAALAGKGCNSAANCIYQCPISRDQAQQQPCQCKEPSHVDTECKKLVMLSRISQEGMKSIYGSSEPFVLNDDDDDDDDDEYNDSGEILITSSQLTRTPCCCDIIPRLNAKLHPYYLIKQASRSEHHQVSRMHNQLIWN